MRLYERQIPGLTEDIYEALAEEDTIEVYDENIEEVQSDIEAVLEEYVRVDNEIADEAHERKIEEDDLTFGRAKQGVADDKGVGIGEDAVGYLIDQLIQTFFHSNFVEEIFATDRKIRRTLAPIIREYMEEDDEDDEDDAYTRRASGSSDSSGDVDDETADAEEDDDETPEWKEEYEQVMDRLGSFDD